MLRYQIKQPAKLQTPEIQTILLHWDVAEWMQLSESEFKEMFAQSEFHLLTDENFKILSIARINFNFKIKMEKQVYKMAELVGLVATEQRRGYGQKLVLEIVKNLKNRQIEAIGFCEKVNRPFYHKCQVPILINRAKQLSEPEGNDWLIPADDDVLILNLSEENTRVFQNLSSGKPGYLLFS